MRIVKLSPQSLAFPSPEGALRDPNGLLAIGGLIAAIMLSVPPIIRASSEALETRRRARSGQG